jgi:hypothetical protein
MPSIDKNKIHIGRGDVYVGGTAPTAGTDPTDPTAGTPSALATATSGFAGVSTGGTFAGATNGPATITYRPTYYGVVTEQTFAEVVTTPTAEEANLQFTALQADYTNIQTALGQSTTRVDAGPPVANANYVGGLTTVSTKVVTLLSRKRSGTGYYIAVVYQGYSAEGSTLNFEARAETRLPVNIRMLADGDRPQGDQLFQVVEYPANPA